MAEQTTQQSSPPHRYAPGMARDIESRWQDRWEAESVFAAPNPAEPGFDASRPKSFVLDMFPYPSGAGLHVGHPLGYIATDIYARFQRMNGRNVLHAMGFDSFGLPAEQYAIETGTHPRDTTYKNIDRFRAQLRRLGLAHDKRRSVCTTDPAFVKWTQWIFLQLFNAWLDPEQNKARHISELIAEFESGARTPDCGSAWSALSEERRAEIIGAHRLAFIAEVDVNWCPALGTVLANEEVTADARSERGNHPVYKRPLRQWMMRITRFAERLLQDLDALDWPEPIKLMQRNWIGRSEGAYVEFSAQDHSIRIFTTCPNTLCGSTYMVLAPEHPLVDQLVADVFPENTPDQWKGVFPGAESLASAPPKDVVAAYRRYAQSRSAVDRQIESKEKTGAFIGAFATNPANNKQIPIFIADYVLMDYGTGAIMAVPAHDERDYDFAKSFDLPIVDVVYPRIELAMHFFAHNAPVHLANDEHWIGALADFLGFITTGDITPQDFAAALDTIAKRRANGDGSSCEIAPGVNDEPAGIGAKRGTVRVAWMDAIKELDCTKFAQLKHRFATGSHYADLGSAFTGDGFAVNSPPIEGLRTKDAKPAMIKWAEENAIGEGAINFKLRDWLFSRQRYWGEPFPIVYAAEDTAGVNPIALPESMLPVELPVINDFRPVASDDPGAPPQPPLGRASEWAAIELDLGDGPRAYKRELNTMPQWAGSCWYYLRYLDPENADQFVAPDVEQYWMQPGGVDLYVGGAEHAVLHLLYARFWHKVLFDLGHVSTREPFHKLFNQGYIQASAYKDARGVYVPATEVVADDGQPADGRTDYKGPLLFNGEPVTREYGKMGKSLKNAVTPDDVCEQYGADTMRLYEMYMGPLEASKPWNPRDIIGSHRFLQQVWRLIVDEESGEPLVVDEPADEDTLRLLHKTIAAVRADYETLGFNTAIAKLFELKNHLMKQASVPRDVAEPFVLMLAPAAPHIAEELWAKLGHDASLAFAPFPAADESLLHEDSVELPVQVQGKVRGRIRIPADADEQATREAALAEQSVSKFIGDKPIRKVIVVPGRMVNIVI